MRVGIALVGMTIAATSACAARTAAPSTAAAEQRSGATITSASAAQRGAGVEAAATLTAADLDGWMKKIGTATTSLRAHVMASQLAEAAREAQDVALWLGEVERFWAQNRKADAVAWTQAARRAATDAAGAAAGGDAMKTVAATVTLQNNCGMCHAAYREGDATSGFRIKSGAVPSIGH
jgi:hypothetical protein